MIYISRLRVLSNCYVNFPSTGGTAIYCSCVFTVNIDCQVIGNEWQYFTNFGLIIIPYRHYIKKKHL